MVDHASGDVYVKCVDGAALTEQQVADAVQADARFTVTAFTMHAPEAAPAEDGQ